VAYLWVRGKIRRRKPVTSRTNTNLPPIFKTHRPPRKIPYWSTCSLCLISWDTTVVPQELPRTSIETLSNHLDTYSLLQLPTHNILRAITMNLFYCYTTSGISALITGIPLCALTNFIKKNTNQRYYFSNMHIIILHKIIQNHEMSSNPRMLDSAILKRWLQYYLQLLSFGSCSFIVISEFNHYGINRLHCIVIQH